MTNGSKCRTVSLRLGTEEERIISNIESQYNINNKSEIFRLALKNMEAQGKIVILSKLCNVCSVVNKILEKSETDGETKDKLQKELNFIWKQLL